MTTETAEQLQNDENIFTSVTNFLGWTTIDVDEDK